MRMVCVSIALALLFNLQCAFAGDLGHLLTRSVRNRKLQTTCNVCPVPPPLALVSGDAKNITGCCANNFRGCGNGAARCRELGSYTIDPTPAALSEQCPPTTGPCTCQSVLSESQNVSIKLCPEPITCCNTCSCRGDPHCTSFDGTTADWVVCDVRDGNCNLPKGPALAEACSQQSFDGVPCVLRPDPTGKIFCQFAPNLTAPMMDMYSKSYINGGLTQHFQIELQLGIMGSVDLITITDAGKAYRFALSFSGGVFHCVVPPVADLKAISSTGFKNNQILIDLLPSGVQIELTCIIKKHAWGTRWEIPELQDQFLPGAAGRAGFCQTGTIVETKEKMKACTMDKKLLNQFDRWGYTCTGDGLPATPSPVGSSDDNSVDGVGNNIALCKKNWCSKPLLATMTGSNWQSLGFSTVADCEKFVLVPGNNFLEAVCAVSPKVAITNPSQCAQDPACLACMQDVTDYPDEIYDNLRVLPTVGASPKCSPDSLLNLGISQAGNPNLLVVGGVKIEFLAPNTVTPVVVWQATDAQIQAFTTACGCRDFLKQSSNPLFITPGVYTITQCFPENNLLIGACAFAPGYIVEADFPTTPIVTDFSIPFGELVSNGDLVCAPSTNCPPDSTCCTWDFQGPGWVSCMGSLASQFPNCGKGNSNVGRR